MSTLASSRGRATELPTRIVTSAVVGIAVIGLLIAVTAGFPFYRLLKLNEAEHFVFEVESLARNIERYLVHIEDVAVQVAARTRAREALEAYNDGAINLEELRAVSEPIFQDALGLGASIAGIVRFDSAGRPVVSAGLPLPLRLIEIEDPALPEPRLLGPYTIDDQRVTIVLAPIRNREGNHAGVDAIAVHFDELLPGLRQYAASGTQRRITLSRLDAGRADTFLSMGELDDAGANASMNERIIEAALRDAAIDEAKLLPAPTSDTSPPTAYYRFGRHDWLLVFQSDPATLNAPIHQALTRYALILAAIISLGALAAYRLLSPLAARIMSLTRNLHSEVEEREAAERSLARRVAQQEAVAELGQLCLADGPIQDLLDYAVRVTAAALQVEYCKVLQIVPGQDRLLVRAGVGWREGIVGIAEVPIDDDSQAGYTLRSATPVSVEDLTTEPRFSGPQLLNDHGVRSGISVIVDPAHPWGVLGAHSTSRQRFSKDDVTFVQSIANCLAEAIERRRAEADSRASEERFRTLYDDTPAMFVTVSADLRIRSINQYGADQLGHSTAALVGEPIESMSHPEDRPLLAEHLDRCLAQQEQIHRWELRKTRLDGSTIWVRETARVVTDQAGNTSVLIVCEDISETRSLSEKLSYEASHDPLTGLVNRREFEHRLDRLIDAARDSGAEHVLCYLDLDQFKVINDSCGHMAGDELLCQLANVLRESLRVGDTIARLGGDEFGLLLEHCSIDRAEVIANELREKVEEFRFSWNRQAFSVGVSMGLVGITDSSGNMTDLLRNADTACYAAKDAGRNRVHVYQQDDAELTKRQGEMQWVAQINKALEENRFRLFAQPIEPIQAAVSNEIHHELLIRLQNADESIVPPGAFLPAAERYGQATKIDKWVVRTLFDYLTTYPDLPAELGTCSINLSGQSLADPEFLAYVSELLSDSDVAPERICFEITETAAISNLTNALSFIEGLKSFGCRFALDDFGSGLSSFAYLKTLPVDYLKIDGLFVKDIIRDRSDFAMVKSIHEIGKSLGKATIAEFVEDDEIKHALRHIGVDYAQGHGIGRPRPLDEFRSVRLRAAGAARQ